MIKITEKALDAERTNILIAAAEVGAINTENGEIPDGAARHIASRYATPNRKNLWRLSAGRPVLRTELLDEISETARRYMKGDGWPRDLEHLSTWVINHD